MGVCYLGGYIGDDKPIVNWLKNLTGKWERNIRAVTETAEKYLQESYAAVARAIQLDWIFFQCVTKYMGQSFKGLEKFLQETSLTCIFFGR